MPYSAAPGRAKSEAKPAPSEAGRGGRQPGAGGGETQPLPLVDRVVRMLGGHQVRHHVAQGDPVQPARVCRQRGDAGRVQAQSVHPRVHVQQRRQRPAQPAGLRRPGVDLRQRPQDGGDVVRGEPCLQPRPQAVQHRHHGAGDGAANGRRLIRVGDEEMPAALGMQPGGDLWRAEAVAIRLYHPRRRAARQAAPVPRDRLEIDFQEARPWHAPARRRTDLHTLSFIGRQTGLRSLGRQARRWSDGSERTPCTASR